MVNIGNIANTAAAGGAMTIVEAFLWRKFYYNNYVSSHSSGIYSILILTSYLMHGNSIVDNVTAGTLYSEAISYIGSSSETFVHNNAEYMVGPHTQ